MSWYALKIFYNRTPLVLDRLSELNKALAIEAKENGSVHTPIEHYYALNAKGKPLVPGLLFVKCDRAEVLRFKRENDDKFLVYQNAEHKPAPIPQREMDAFILVTSAAQAGLEYIGPDLPEYHVGDLVRVLSGPYAGVEGYIRRVKKDRRLFVCISGVAVVATAFVDPRQVEKVEKAENTEK